MKVKWHWVSAALLAVVVIVQLIPVARTNPPVGQPMLVSPEVQSVLERSCYDCHSNETEWPWYSYIAPVSWIVADHVHEGREHLNFSIWYTYDIDEIADKLEEIAEGVEDGAMPLSSYVRMHGDAQLSEEDRAMLVRWATGG